MKKHDDDLTKSKAELKQAWIEMKTLLATDLLYLGFRMLGATKTHAWDRARGALGTAVIDKTIEQTGILDPRNAGKPGVQAYFEGGPLDGTTRFVEECGAVDVTNSALPKDDPRRDIYARTSRKRVQQTVFEYVGLMVPPSRASLLKRA